MRNFTNPFRPGAGHIPPFMAGRDTETKEFLRLISQDEILENMVLTGLRGVGKTVLLESLKPQAIQDGWIWVGTDLSESASVSEDRIAIRLCADLAVVTSGIVLRVDELVGLGFTGESTRVEHTLGYDTLLNIYQHTPGLPSDKLKAVIETAWRALLAQGYVKGILFAYDEAQNLSDQAEKTEYPLSLILDTFQSLQRKGLPVMLVLTGLPTLFPKLVEARTFAERMFRVVCLESLNATDSRRAILEPITDGKCPIHLSDESVDTIVELSGGYPYFIQFICREVYDVFMQQIVRGQNVAVPVVEIVNKLDTDFFAGRWARVTDRQRELLSVIALLDNCNEEFSVQDVVKSSNKHLEKPFSNSHINQMFSTLSDQGLIFRNRHGRYSFAVPLMGRFIERQGILDGKSQ